jgi:hypothetical protein
MCVHNTSFSANTLPSSVDHFAVGKVFSAETVSIRPMVVVLTPLATAPYIAVLGYLPNIGLYDSKCLLMDPKITHAL